MDTKKEISIYDSLAIIFMEAEWNNAQRAYGLDPVVIPDKMEKHLKAARRWSYVRSGIRKAAAVLLILVSAAGTLVLINEEVRAEFVRFIHKHFMTHTEYEFRNDDLSWKDEFCVYVPAWIPEGYTEAYRSMDEDGGWIRYDATQDGKIQEIYFICKDERSTGMSLNTENTRRSEIVYQGQMAEYYEAYEEGFLSSFVWGNEWGCRFVLSGNLTLEEFRKIADSLVEAE